MMENLFDLNDLMQLIVNAINPYTIDARLDNASILDGLPCSPTENVEQKIHAHLSRFLKDYPEWPLETFLAFACGLLHRKFFIKLQRTLIPHGKNNSNDVEEVVDDIYYSQSYRAYLMENLPEVECLVEDYKHTYIFIKSNRKAFYITPLGNSISIDIDATKFDQLVQKIGNLDEFKALQETIPDSTLLSKFYELISANRMECTRKKIAEAYTEWFELISNQYSQDLREPSDWLKLIQRDPNLRSKIQLPQYMVKIITINHFKLNEENVRNGLQRGTTVDIEQAAKILTTGLERDVRPQQVLDYCAQGHFNAYINREAYVSRKKSEEEISITDQKIKPIQEVETAINDNSIDQNFQYPVQGLIRLKNSKNRTTFLENQTVTYLRDGGTIPTTLEASGSMGLQRELSLSEFIFNINGFITTNGQPIARSDLLFLEQELANFVKKLNYKKNLKTFNWQDFYCFENTEIIKSLIKKPFITVDELADTLAKSSHEKMDSKIDSKEVLSIFQGMNAKKQHLLCGTLFTKADAERIIPGKIALFHRDKVNFQGNTKVIPSEAIKRLIESDLLSPTICQLPRDLAQAIHEGFLPEKTQKEDILPTYYDAYSELYGSDQLLLYIHSQSQKPLTLLTYSELKNRWKDYPQDEMIQLCLEQKLGAYYPVTATSKFIGMGSDIKKLSAYNCGNPFYKIRYHGLEKLTIQTLTTLRTSDQKPSELDNFFDTTTIIFQSTDFEMKFHMYRYIEKEGDLIIKLSDLKFIKEEVESIEAELRLQHKDKNVAQRENELHTVLSAIYYGEKEKGNATTNKAIWNLLRDETRRKNYDSDDIIQQVTRDRIDWANSSGKERSMQKTTFENKKWLKNLSIV